MDCREVQDRLSAYLDGELTPPMAEDVGKHLEQCTDCSAECSAFRGISNLSAPLKSLSARDHWLSAPDRWLEIKAKLSQPATASRNGGLLSVPTTWGQFATAACLFLAVLLGFLAMRSSGVTGHRTVDLSEFVGTFHREPARAEKILLASYHSQPIDLPNSASSFSAQPVLAAGLPPEYKFDNAHVLKMPCCPCLQATFVRADGSCICFFETAGDQPMNFGNRPATTADCAGKETLLVQVDGSLTASWQAGSHRLTLVGAKNIDEVNRLVGHLSRVDEQTRSQKGT